MKGVAFFPSVTQLSANPYWPMLASALEQQGINLVHDAPPAFHPAWLIRNRKRVDILHIHYVHQFYATGKRGITRLLNILRFALNMVFARILGFRTVFTLHNLEPTYYYQPAWLDSLGHWVAANFSSAVIVHCREAEVLLRKKYGRRGGVFLVEHPNFIHTYPNFISKDDARKQLGLPDDAVIFTFFGGIRPNKGLETLIEAFKNLEGDKYRLVIAGSINPPESYAQSIQDMAGNDERISFYFRLIPDDEVQVFMNSADIVVLPFARILTSGSAILALSFGRPVIAPRMGCLPELIGKQAGWLFEPDDSDSLLGAMRLALVCNLNEAGCFAIEKIAMQTVERFGVETVCAYLGKK